MKTFLLDGIGKAASRKFLITLLALFTLLESANLTTLQTIVIGAVAAVYVLAQAFVDRAAATPTGASLMAAAAVGLESGKALADGDLTDEERRRIRELLASPATSVTNIHVPPGQGLEKASPGTLRGIGEAAAKAATSQGGGA